MLGSVLPITARGLASLMILLIWGVGCSQPGDSTAAVTRAPRIVDSLLWKTPAVARFFIKVLGDSQTVDYRSFTFKGSGRFVPKQYGISKPPSGPTDSHWVFSPDKKMAASIKGYEGEADNILELFNRRQDGKIETLEVCGTPCGYRGLYWPDNRRFIFVKTHEVLQQINDSTLMTSGFTPIVILYDVPAESAFTYVTTPIPVRPSK
jgi:hypothetical protein